MFTRGRPFVTDDNRHFWTGGSDGRLHFSQCQDCNYYIHPPAPVCRQCHSVDIGVGAVEGTGTIVTYTVNIHPWTPEVTEPYSIVIVELDAQPGLKLTSNLVGCPPGDTKIGQRVEVTFEQDGEIYYPLFRPVRVPAAAGAESA